MIYTKASKNTLHVTNLGPTRKATPITCIEYGHYLSRFLEPFVIFNIVTDYEAWDDLDIRRIFSCPQKPVLVEKNQDNSTETNEKKEKVQSKESEKEFYSPPKIYRFNEMIDDPEKMKFDAEIKTVDFEMPEFKYFDCEISSQ